MRRLTPATVVTPGPESSDAPTLPLGPATNGNGASHAVARSAGVRIRQRPACRAVPVPTIDRMQVEEVSIAYGSKPAVKSVSLPIRQGEVLALIGPSGCGKTTLLRSLNRLTELTKTASLRGRITA